MPIAMKLSLGILEIREDIKMKKMFKIYLITDSYYNNDVELDTIPKVYNTQEERDREFADIAIKIEDAIRTHFGDGEELPEDLDDYAGDSFYYSKDDCEIFYRSYELGDTETRVVKTHDMVLPYDESDQPVLWDLRK